MAGEYPELTFDDTEDFTADRLNRAMLTLDARLRAQEALRPSYEDAVDTLNRFGLSRLDAALQPVYSRLMTIGRIGVIFQVICSTPNRLGQGLKSFIIPADRRLTFAPAAYLQIVSTGDGSKSMYGSTQSYDEVTGELIVRVDQVRGIDEGVIDSWSISAAGTPVVFNNANELGVYTQAQSDEKIAQAINALRGSVPADRMTLAAINAALESLTDGAVNIRNFAQASTAINNRLQVDKAQGLNATAQRQGLANLGISDFIKDLLTQTSGAAARSYLGVSDNTVAKTGDTMTGKLSIVGAPLEISGANPYMDLVWGNVMRARVKVQNDGSVAVGNGDSGDTFAVFGTSGALWTKQVGDLQTVLNTKVAKDSPTRQDLVADMLVNKTYPTYGMIYPNVFYSGWQVRENGGTYLMNMSNSDGLFMIGTDGSMWTKQLGDINNRLESRAAAHAQAAASGCVQSARWMHVGDKPCNDSPGTGGFISPFGGHCMSCDYWTWRFPAADGQVGSAPFAYRYRRLEIYIPSQGWVIVGAGS
jgi:hypothetical protein